MITDDHHFDLRLARDETDVLGAQRLRYKVFVAELGADGPLVDHQSRLERDALDPYFDHLVLVDNRRDAAALDHVVGVYRLLPGERAAAAGRFYSDGEFDLTLLRVSRKRLLELGRSCVHAAYRGGPAMFLLWNALAEYVEIHEIELMFGVASFHGTDPLALRQPLAYLYHHHLAPQELRVRARSENFSPMNLLAAEQVDRAAAMLETPALIKAYLRLGGFVGDGVYIDRVFNTTDVFLMMDTTKMPERYRAYYRKRTRLRAVVA